jgi:hypothetical protein
MLCCVVLVRTDVSEEVIVSIIRVTRTCELWTSAVTSQQSTLRRSLLILATLLMEALGSSETSALTRAKCFNISEDGILRSHSCENVKSYREKNLRLLATQKLKLDIYVVAGTLLVSMFTPVTKPTWAAIAQSVQQFQLTGGLRVRNSISSRIKNFHNIQILSFDHPNLYSVDTWRLCLEVRPQECETHISAPSCADIRETGIYKFTSRHKSLCHSACQVKHMDTFASILLTKAHEL